MSEPSDHWHRASRPGIPRVHWFRNAHEHRNDWLRFGLMLLHRADRVRYEEHPLSACTVAGFDTSVAQHRHRHTSVVLVEGEHQRRRCIVDSEDSFFFLSPLVKVADVYFCAGYNRSFFEGRAFAPPFDWQQPCEVEFYVTRAKNLIRDYGAVFDRVRPFVPIAPSMDMTGKLSPAMQRLRNLLHKLLTRLWPARSWWFSYLDFESRYRDLLRLRESPPLYDIVSLDTLWGWPRHRHALHLRLRELTSAGKSVHARLRWSQPSAIDGSDKYPLDPADFPLESGVVGDYEAMLAASRIAVFATGFHWGWRNIMTLSLMWGLPIHADRLLLEPWFDMARFEIGWNDDSSWSNVAAALDAVTDAERLRIKARNQAAFDDLLAPEKVAEYFIRAALSDSESRSRIL